MAYLFDRLNHRKENLPKWLAVFSSISFGVGALFFLFVLAPPYFIDIVRAEKGIFAGSGDAHMMLERYVSFVTIGILITGFFFHSPMILIFLKMRKKQKDTNNPVK